MSFCAHHLVLAVCLVAGGDPPAIEYGPGRTSTAWVETTQGSSVAVDHGVEWQGLRVYLSLTWDLLAVDVATGKCVWDCDVGAFWNRVGFEQVADGGGQRWAVVLRPARGAQIGADLKQLHDLRTGRLLEQTPALPGGAPFAPRAAHGDQSLLPQPFHGLFTTQDVWARARHAIGGTGWEPLGDVDFTRSAVLVVHAGESFNCRGIIPIAAFEDENRVLLRVDNSSFQTEGHVVEARPWGVFVLPRADKVYVVEMNVQGLIGGPPIWREQYRVARLPAPEEQLKVLAREL